MFCITLLPRTGPLFLHYKQDVEFSFIGSRILFPNGNILHQQQMFWVSLRQDVILYDGVLHPIFEILRI